ncbi:MAG: LAGLIDADG family homing endonuclease, partial [Candidatus Nanoarchaeia archaeon]|nr:LAGLIDADG family homing endonuclease [Candidatus Nanoarchaeia archaeon]
MINKLAYIQNLLIEANVVYFLDCGALLHWYRDKEIDKSDIDFGVLLKDYSKIQEIIEKHKSDFEMVYYRDKEISLRYLGTKFDFICYAEKDDKISLYAYKQNPFCNNKWNYEWKATFPKDVYFPLKTMEVEHLVMPVPNNIEERLALQYGRDWQTPKNVPCWTYELNEAKVANYNPIAVLMTTIARDEILMKVLPSYLQYPVKLYLLDQGEETEVKNKYYDELRNQGHFIEYSHKDIGLSGARNYLLSKLEDEEYVFLTEDDIELQTNPYSLLSEFTNNNLGILGGLLIRKPSNTEQHYEYELSFENKVFEYKKSDKIDIVLNFFLAKAKVFKDIQWDEALPLCEHSVAKDTSILIKDGYNRIKCIPISKLFPVSIDKLNRKHYKVSKTNKTQIWTDKGWKKIIGIFKHKVKKQIYSILTNRGYIECTSDHSLIINNKKIKPTELKIGDSLELCDYPKLSNKLNVDLEWAWLLGLFLAEGCYRKKHAQCDIANQDLNILNKAKNILQKFAIDSHIVLNRHKKNHCNYLKFKPFKMIDNYFSYFYLGKEKIIPTFVFDFNLNSRKAFFEGFMVGDGYKTSACKGLFSQKSQSIVNGLFYLLHDIYPNRSVAVCTSKLGKWFIGNLKQLPTKNPCVIKKITTKIINEEVYDIETENHHFCGGVGNVNLHNSDYFWRLKQLNKWKVGYTRKLSGWHHHYKPDDYLLLRNRSMQYLDVFMKKWDIRKIVKDNKLEHQHDELTVFVITHDNEPNLQTCLTALEKQTI